MFSIKNVLINGRKNITAVPFAEEKFTNEINNPKRSYKIFLPIQMENDNVSFI